jgi:hypothetical protein
MAVYVVAHFAGLTYDRGCLKSHLGSNTHTYVQSSELYMYIVQSFIMYIDQSLMYIVQSFIVYID